MYLHSLDFQCIVLNLRSKAQQREIKYADSNPFLLRLIFNYLTGTEIL